MSLSIIHHEEENRQKPFELGEYFTNLFQVQWSRSLHVWAVTLHPIRTASWLSQVTHTLLINRFTFIYMSEVTSPGQRCFSPPKLHFLLSANLTDKNVEQWQITLVSLNEVTHYNEVTNFTVLQKKIIYNKEMSR